MTSPCKDCPSRRQGFHSECNRYLLFATFQRHMNRHIREMRSMRRRLTTDAQERIKTKKLKKYLHQKSNRK